MTTPAWLEAFRAPSGALPTIALDFIDQNYWDGTAEVAITDLLGGGFDAGALSSLGMEVSAANNNRPVAQGALLAALQPNHTVAVGWSTIAAGNTWVLFALYDDAGGSQTSGNCVDLRRHAHDTLVLEDWANLSIEGTATEVSGTNKAAVNLAASALSLNGETAAQQSAGYALALIGHRDAAEEATIPTGGGAMFRSFAVYPIQPAAHLGSMPAR